MGDRKRDHGARRAGPPPRAEEEHEAALTLAAAHGVGPGAAAELRSRFPSYASVVTAALDGRDDLPDRVAAAIRSSAAARAGRNELRLIRASGARYVVWGGDEYPVPLSVIARPPVGVSVAGLPLDRLQPAVAVVGTRVATRRGLTVARDIAFDIAAAGLTVVSGLARGVDTAAHEGALEAGGTTVAVLGTGLGCVYPAENAALARRIRRSGALVSECPIRQGPRPGAFPARNRIIAGLSAGVVVVEAGSRSGALITAARALEEGREVFAVPGPITEPLSSGPNGLIKAGAKLVESVEDILEELEPSIGSARPPAAPPGPRKDAANGDAAREDGGGEDGRSRLLRQLAVEPRTIDELSARSGLTPSDVSQLLLDLELSGRACACPGGTYAMAEARRRGGRRRNSGRSRRRPGR